MNTTNPLNTLIRLENSLGAAITTIRERFPDLGPSFKNPIVQDLEQTREILRIFRRALAMAQARRCTARPRRAPLQEKEPNP